MNSVQKAMQQLNSSLSEQQQDEPISFENFLYLVSQNPQNVFRNVFQIFHDMAKSYVGEGFDEYPDDPESIHFVSYDCKKLFVEGSDHPFFADRIFSNRFMNQVEALRHGAQQNKIYIFEGPHGGGKSTFLNNLLRKFEEYANTEEGSRYENVWRINRKMLGAIKDIEKMPVFEKLFQLLEYPPEEQREIFQGDIRSGGVDDIIEVPCPSHDNPILMIPKNSRRSFFDDLVKNDEFKYKLFTEKEYEWVFRDNPCTICTSLYQAFLNKLKSPLKVFQLLLYARPYRFNRRLGEGISVFNPGDKMMKQSVLTNAMLQSRINTILKDSNQVSYIYSRYAKTNNGIYALMDIKSHNTERLIELHNIVSEGVHKVEDIEENVNSLLIALMNPEDKKNIQDIPSFTDRIEYINVPYVMDLNTEVEIYRNIFGRHIDDSFLPRVLHNFARVIIATRLNTESKALLEWIGDPEKYALYCDKNLQLLKMEIYTGHIPSWLSEEDRKQFTARRRREIINDSNSEGQRGFSGRDSIRIFNEFFSNYARTDKLINMSTLCLFFKNYPKDEDAVIPDGFLESMLHMYDYTVLQEVKESLYYYNEEQISKDIQNYMFAVNFETGSNETSRFTKERLEITEDFFESIERMLLGPKILKARRIEFRRETQKEYTSKTLTQEILIEGKDITETTLYHNLHERYIHNLKEKALDPFLDNENFRRAIKDFDEEDFKSYDKRIRADVTFLIKNLKEKHKYTQQGAKEICIYVIDNDLAKKFSSS